MPQAAKPRPKPRKNLANEVEGLKRRLGDLEARLRAIEDASDVAAAEAALADPVRIPYEQVRREMGLPAASEPR